MNTEKEIILTPEGLDKLEKELEKLKTVKRREVARRIKEAIEFGDITENSNMKLPKMTRHLLRANHNLGKNVA